MSQETLTLLTIIGTFLAAIATFLTVLEMRWQRRTTYKPDLIVESTGFDIYPDGRDHFGTIATDRKRPEGKRWTHLSLTARNAGFGPAKSVTFSWETDLQDFLESIGRVDASVVDQPSMTRVVCFGSSIQRSGRASTTSPTSCVAACLPSCRT
jgi:hypothetical protein